MIVFHEMPDVTLQRLHGVRWEYTFIHEKLTQGEAVWEVDAEYVQSDSAHGSFGSEFGTAPGKVVIPVVISRMKESDNFVWSSVWIDARDITLFLIVTRKTGPGQICHARGAMVFLGVDMVQVKHQRVEFFGYLTVFATSPRSPPNPIAECLGHELDLLERAAGDRFEHRDHVAETFKVSGLLFFRGTPRPTISLFQEFHHPFLILPRKIDLQETARALWSE